MSKTKIMFGITGSFCNHEEILKTIRQLMKENYEVVITVSDKVRTMDTRYGKASDFMELLSQLSSEPIITSIQEAELFAMTPEIKAMVIAPMTATSIGKFAHGIYDNAVLMSAKGMLRNQKPVVLGIASNDGLGISGVNIMQLMATKQVFFVPFRQDDYNHKPNSLVSDFTKVEEAVAAAIAGIQAQPVLLAPIGK